MRRMPGSSPPPVSLTRAGRPSRSSAQRRISSWFVVVFASAIRGSSPAAKRLNGGCERLPAAKERREQVAAALDAVEHDRRREGGGIETRLHLVPRERRRDRGLRNGSDRVRRDDLL